MQRLQIVLLAFCLLIFVASPALASGEGAHESWVNLGLRVLNLAIFAGAIYYLWGKKIIALFRSRSEGIAADIAGLEERKANAQTTLAEVEKRIAGLEEERRAILTEYTAQGERLKAGIIEQGEKAAAQILEQARQTAQNEIKAAIDGIRAEMADNIIEATEQLIAKKLTATEHTKLVDQYLTKVVLN